VQERGISIADKPKVVNIPSVILAAGTSKGKEKENEVRVNPTPGEIRDQEWDPEFDHDMYDQRSGT
jgi:hypothetical protein